MDTVFQIKGKDLHPDMINNIREQFGDAQVEIIVHHVPDASGMLDETGFWKLIDQLDWSANQNEAIIEPVVRALSDMPIANVYRFQDILSEKLFRLDTREHAANLEEQDGYLSVDDFLYVRCAVVANGKSVYNEVLARPQKMPVDLTFSPLLRIAKLAYERKTGKKMTILPAFGIETFSNSESWA
ncbi:MAG: DUF4240 domain-containing protein [Saprospiraceae bacterium]|nr:DUF4240 domain-containing protein [Saprospiraceae bacterium]